MPVSKTFKANKSVDIPEGTQLGLFMGLVHIGTQRSEYKGEVSIRDQVILKFELPDVLLDDGRPVTIVKRETNSCNKKSNMLKVVKALKGGKDVDEVDFESLIGLPVMLDLKANTKGNVNINGYMAVPEALKKTIKPMMNEPVLLFDVEQISDKELKTMPEWLQKVINERMKPEDIVNPDIDY